MQEEPKNEWLERTEAAELPTDPEQVMWWSLWWFVVVATGMLIIRFM